jgi:hypothetical protein
MVQLTSLTVIDLPKLPNIEDIESLSAFTELFLSGNHGSLTPPLRLTSLEPVTRLPALQGSRWRIHVWVTMISRCFRSAKACASWIYLTGSSAGNFAYLAKHLNGQLAEPMTGYVPTKLPCKKCGEDKVMFRGRRMPFLCGNCDAERFRKLEKEFASLVERS